MKRNFHRIAAVALIASLLVDPASATPATAGWQPVAHLGSPIYASQAINPALAAALFRPPLHALSTLALIGALTVHIAEHSPAAHGLVYAVAIFIPRAPRPMVWGTASEERVNSVREIVKRYPVIRRLLSPKQKSLVDFIEKTKVSSTREIAKHLQVPAKSVSPVISRLLLADPPRQPEGWVESVEPGQYHDIPVANLKLRRRTASALAFNGIETVGQLLKAWRDGPVPMPRIDYSPFFRILNALAARGIHHTRSHGWVQTNPSAPEWVWKLVLMAILAVVPALPAWTQSRSPPAGKSRHPAPKALRQLDGGLTVIGLAMLPGFWRRRDTHVVLRESGDQEKIALLLELMHLYPAAVETFNVHEKHFLEIILGKNFGDFNDLSLQTNIPYSQLIQRFNKIFMKFRDLDAVETLGVDEGTVHALARNDIHFVSSLLRAWPKGPVGLSGIGAKGQLALILALEREGLKYDYVAERWISNIFGGATTLSQEPSLLTAIRTVAERLETALPRRMPVMKRWLMDWILAHSRTSIPDISREAELSAARIFWHLRALHTYLKDQEHRIRVHQHDERLILAAA